eukprot:scaffold82847_cov71-Phaeocystis_antarctica.AAC.4
MLSRWGLGRTLGPGGVSHESQLSVHSQQLLDAEVLETLHASHARASALLRRHRRQLRAVAEALTQRDTLSSREVDEVLEQSRQAAPVLAWAMGWPRPAAVATAAVTAPTAAVTHIPTPVPVARLQDQVRPGQPKRMCCARELRLRLTGPQAHRLTEFHLELGVCVTRHCTHRHSTHTHCANLGLAAGTSPSVSLSSRRPLLAEARTEAHRPYSGCCGSKRQTSAWCPISYPMNSNPSQRCTNSHAAVGQHGALASNIAYEAYVVYSLKPKVSSRSLADSRIVVDQLGIHDEGAGFAPDRFPVTEAASEQTARLRIDSDVSFCIRHVCTSKWPMWWMSACMVGL